MSNNNSDMSYPRETPKMEGENLWVWTIHGEEVVFQGSTEGEWIKTTSDNVYEVGH